ncbi:MAG: heat-inducible transcription repressor HrcA [Clostridia bacterium]|nr:heat-inducible transcription repressor HrcA [Clostridia bacterium]
MHLPERKKNVLKAIVENYILTAEPQGSKSIASELGSVSPATIRHDMSDLEEMGFLEKPHVSAGRVPSSMAYRFYVDELMDRYNDTANEIEQLQSLLESKIADLDNIAQSASQILSEITNYAGISFKRHIGPPVFTKIQLMPLDNGRSYALIAVTTSSEIKSRVINLDRPVSDSEIDVFVGSVNKLLKEKASKEVFNAVLQIMSPLDAIYPLAVKVFDFISAGPDNRNENVYIEGTTKLLTQPEFQKNDRALKLFEFLSKSENISSMATPSEGKLVNIKISPQTQVGELSDTAFVFTTYDMGEDIQGVLGVVGPSRMDYAEVAAKLEAFAKTLGRFYPAIGQHNDK